MSRGTLLVLCLSLVLIQLCTPAAAFYLPGVAPRDYIDGEPVYMKVNSLTSAETQLPYKYYDLPFCRPPTIVDMIENLGEILSGDRIENSPYVLNAGRNVECKVLCATTLSKKDLALLSERIDEEYRVHWILDNLPAATSNTLQDADGKLKTVYEPGFQLGVKNGKEIGGEDGKFYINNHAFITIKYHTNEANYDGLRIVGFEVSPDSIKHSDYDSSNPDAFPETCITSQGPQPVGPDQEETTIVWTYRVHWQQSSVRWASRWDVYLMMGDDQIHWFSIINSLMIVLFLTGMIGMVLMRTLHQDFRRYELESQEDAQEETGWKLVHGDVFRKPSHRMLLSVLVGTGVQLFCATIITMIFAVLGFLSPANRGALMTAAVVLFTLMGVFAGYFSARCYKSFEGSEWKQNTLATAFGFPGFCFVVFFVLNLLLLEKSSAGFVPIGTMLALISLWFGVSVPLTFVGSYFAYRKPVDPPPCRVNRIPRQEPPQVWYMRPVFTILMGGILPFGAVFIELFFLFSSIFNDRFYYLFGFLSIVFVILVITAGEVSILFCYFALCSETYRWHWPAFLTPASSGIYMFLYGSFYFFTKLHINSAVSVLLYFGYMLLLSCAFSLLTGAVGFYSCNWFVRKIYSSIKVD